MNKLDKAKKTILGATYAVEGILVQAGGSGAAIASVDEDNPLKFSGKELAAYGYDVVRLLQEGYLYPVTDQIAVDGALKTIEEARNVGISQNDRQGSHRRRVARGAHRRGGNRSDG